MNPLSMGMLLGIIGAIISLPLMLVGILFVRMGLRPKREGTEPHCRKCDYLLTGIDSARCPECGTIIDETTKVIGHRKRLAGLTGTGMAFILIGLTALIPIAVAGYTRVNWYHFKPTFLVMRDLDAAGTNLLRAARPWMEMIRREKADALSKSLLNGLVDKGLQVQIGLFPPSPPPPNLNGTLTIIPVQPSVRSLEQQITEFLWRQAITSKMSSAQREMFLMNMNRLHVQSVSPPDDNKMNIVVQMGFSIFDIFPHRTLHHLRIDGRETNWPALSQSISGDAYGFYVSCPEIGDHVLDMVCRISVIDANGTQLFVQELPLSSKFRVTKSAEGEKNISELPTTAPAH